MQVRSSRNRLTLLLLHKIVPGTLTFHLVNLFPRENQRRKRVRLPERIGDDMFHLHTFQLMSAIPLTGKRTCPVHVHGDAALAYQIGRKRFPR